MAVFQWRARRCAWEIGDRFSLISSTRPRDLALLLELALGRTHVVELGTATAWTSISLVLADPRRHVLTYDPIPRRHRAEYLKLVPAQVQDQIEFITSMGLIGPADEDETPVGLLYIDSSHDKDETIAELRAWIPVLPPGAIVVLDDYSHSVYRGVREAVHELGLAGSVRGGMYVHRVQGSTAPGAAAQPALGRHAPGAPR